MRNLRMTRPICSLGDLQTALEEADRLNVVAEDGPGQGKLLQELHQVGVTLPDARLFDAQERRQLHSIPG